MNILQEYDPKGWTAQYTVELIKNQDKAEKLFKRGENLLEKMTKERKALGTLQDAKIAEELARKKIEDAESVHEQAKKAAAKLIKDATISAEEIYEKARSEIGRLDEESKDLEERQEEFRKTQENHDKQTKDLDKELDRRRFAVEKKEQELVEREKRVDKIFRNLDKIIELR